MFNQGGKMPLLNPVIEDKEVNKKYRFKKTLIEEISAYCRWSNVGSDNHFFIEAAQYILKKDKEWQKSKDAILETDKES